MKYDIVSIYSPIVSNAVVEDRKRVSDSLNKLFQEEKDDLIKACKFIIDVDSNQINGE